jgi:ABC-type nitrate/sulfonate/bicarbonate transport system substrate-binding protein
MLDDNGLGEDDYAFESIGAPAQRWAAVKAGTHVGALLTDELTEIAVRAGHHAMTSDPDPWDNYQGNAYVVRRDWAEAHGEQLTGFVRAFLQAVRWTLDPANRDALIGMLKRHLPALGADQAAAAARALQRPKSILTPDMPLNIPGIRTVLALRSRYGTSPKTLDDPFRYVDLSYYEAARASLGAAREATR